MPNIEKANGDHPLAFLIQNREKLD
jgi:hypothetical protein